MSYDELMKDYIELKAKIQETESIISESENKIVNLQNENLNLQLQINTYKKMIFGSRRESTPQKDQVINATQCSLFEIENKEEKTETEEEIIEKTNEDLAIKPKRKNKKVVGGLKKEKLKDIEIETIEYELNKEAVCPKCNSELKVISKKVVHQEIKYIPAKFVVVNYVQNTYKCIKCGTAQSEQESATFVKSQVPYPLLTHSFISPSLATEVIYQKYFLGVPLYRQENFWEEKGLVLPRSMMANWVIKLCEYYFTGIYNLIYEVMKNTNQLLHADETTIQCNKEKDRKATSKSYMWLLSSGEFEDKQAVIFKYSPSRSKETSKQFIGDYKGILVTDGYAAYNGLENITHAECWAHVRRKYYDSIPLLFDKSLDTSSCGYAGVEFCNQLFDIERKIKNLSVEDKKIKRQELSKPVIDAFFEWVNSNLTKVIVNDKLKTALIYSQNQKNELCEFLNNGLIPISNNLAENAIRPFAVHRKNWLFADSIDGAETNAIIYSIIESAKRNNLNINKYINYLLESIPQLDEPNNKMVLKEFLPWSTSLPNEIKNNGNNEELPETIEGIEKLLSQR